MDKQKFRPTRLGGFSGAKAYMSYVKVLKNRRNAVGWTFCDAITMFSSRIWIPACAGMTKLGLLPKALIKSLRN